MSTELLPDRLRGADLVSTDVEQPQRRTAFRVRQNSWTWQDPDFGDLNYRVTVSQQWPGWHNSLNQHQRLGWIPDSLEQTGLIMQSGVVSGLPVVVADFHNTMAEHSFLAFCQMDAFGEPFEPPLTWRNPADFWRRAAERINHRIRPRLMVPDALAIQVQVQTVGPVPESVKRRAVQLLEAAAEEIHRQIINGPLPVESGAADDNNAQVMAPADRPPNLLSPPPIARTQ